jgi:hypothetical protein
LRIRETTPASRDAIVYVPEIYIDKINQAGNGSVAIKDNQFRLLNPSSIQLSVGSDREASGCSWKSFLKW